MRSKAHVPPPDIWPRCAELFTARGIKLIFEEIPSGLGKTGRFFAHEHFGLTPDIVVMGKALGGGVLLLAAVIGDESLTVAFRGLGTGAFLVAQWPSFWIEFGSRLASKSDAPDPYFGPSPQDSNSLDGNHQ
jgi:glutamate-1-semialdehyde aminotransferase